MRVIDMRQNNRRVPLALVILAQTVGGIALGAGLAFAGSWIGVRFFAGDPAGFGDIVASIFGIIIGYALGNALAVVLIGRAFARRGAWWAPLLAVILAEVAVLVVMRFFFQGQFYLGWGLLALMPPLSAIGAYFLSERRAKPAP